MEIGLTSDSRKLLTVFESKTFDTKFGVVLLGLILVPRKFVNVNRSQNLE